MKKKISTLVTLILIFVIIVNFSCSKEEILPVDSVGNGLYDPAYEPYITRYLSDIKYMGVLTSNDTIYFTGLKNDHLFLKIVQFDKSKDVSLWKTITECEDTSVTDTIQKIDIGYGENNVYMITMVKYNQYQSIITSDNSIFVIDLFPNYGSPINKMILLKTQNEVKKISLPGRYMSGVTKWYNNSFVANYEVYFSSMLLTFYSEKGDSLFSTEYNRGTPNLILNSTPISYEQAIRVYDKEIQKYNYRLNRPIWITSLKSLFNETSGSNHTYTLLDKTTDIWKYKLNIVYLDGTKKEYKFKININDGVMALFE